ncbi:MAG TPA: FxLYD domain-containing protein [Acidimicrobiales bacterium]|nr:FxLYD domain-containing protein [Acidimicrobiales bacterium]
MRLSTFARRSLVATFTVLAVVLPAAQVSAAPRVAITYLTPILSPGGVLTIKAQTPAGARCDVTLESLKARAPQTLGFHRVATGHTMWRYRIPAMASSDGLWQVRVACSPRGSVARFVRVGPPSVAPAQISVGKTGFVVQTYSFDTTSFIECGVELTNTSASDARNLTVTVTFVDTQGRSVATTQTDLALIPAGQTFWMSCLKSSAVSISPASMQVQVQVGQNTTHTGRLPVVSNLTLTPNSAGLVSSQTLVGTLTNTYATPLSPDAEIYAVYLDATGTVIGSDMEWTGASVEPGASVNFSFSNLSPNVASAEVSVDPCGGVLAGTAACPLP